MTVRAGAGGTTVTGGLASDADAIFTATASLNGSGGFVELPIGDKTIWMGVAATAVASAPVAAPALAPPAPATAISVSLSGTGTLSASLLQRNVAAATLSGAGTFSSDLKQFHVAAAAFSGASNLSANVTQYLGVFATLSGSGNLSAEEKLKQVAVATFAGAGNFSASLSVVQASNALEATFAGAGFLSASASQILVATTSFAGTGNLTADANVVSVSTPISAVFAGAGNLIANARAVLVATARLAGNGILSATATTATRLDMGVAAVAVAAAPVAAPALPLRDTRLVGETTFTGAGNFSANASVITAANTIATTFAGSGGLNAHLTTTTELFATFEGAGSFIEFDTTAPSNVWMGVAAVPVGAYPVAAPKLNDPAQDISAISATFHGTSGLNVRANLIATANALLQGAGDFGESSFLLLNDGVFYLLLEGGGRLILAGSRSNLINVEATFAGNSRLNADAHIRSTSGGRRIIGWYTDSKGGIYYYYEESDGTPGPRPPITI